MESNLKTYFECLGYLVAEVTWDDKCPQPLKQLRLFQGSRKYINLEILRSWSESHVRSVALQIYTNKKEK